MSSDLKLNPNGIFAPLSQSTLDELVTHGEFVEIEPGAVLIEEGAYQDELFYVVAGKLSVEVGGEFVANIEEGESIGEANLFFASAASAKVTSVEDVKLWKISKTQMASFIIDNKDAGMSLMSAVICLLSERLQSLNAVVANRG